MWDTEKPRDDFNEGGADCPPRQAVKMTTYAITLTSMKGGRTAPRDLCLHSASGDAADTSMKGGRTAPRDGLQRENSAALPQLQ